jgi:hypothetical protein
LWSFTDEHRLLHGILQLANVARPRICFQGGQGFVTDAAQLFFQLLTKTRRHHAR